jgi:protein-S-isoprenylcysteine O-methyltransferase Ste14
MNTTAAGPSRESPGETSIRPPPAKQRPAAAALLKLRYITGTPWAFAVIFFAKPLSPWSWLGAALVAAGAALRFWVGGYAAPENRSTAGGAEGFLTAGPYAWVRNPLHVGNVAVAVGLSLWAGGLLPWLPLATAAFFVWQYSLIKRAEEEETWRLSWEYRAYRATVPAWFPRFTPQPTRRTRRWRPALAFKNEFRTLVIIIVIATASLLHAYLKAGVA